MSRQVRLQDHVYERIESDRRDDESFSEAIERLIGGCSLRDLRGAFDESEVVEMCEAIENLQGRDRDSLQRLQTVFDTPMTAHTATERLGPEDPDEWGPGVSDDSTDD